MRWPPNSGSQFTFSLEEYRAKFDEYLEYCIEEQRQPFLMDFASFCGITDQTARNYAKRGDTDEEKAQWRALHDLIVQYSEVEMWQAMLQGKVKEKSAAMFLVNFNKRVANRTINDNRNETSGKVQVTSIQRTIIDPQAERAQLKAELKQQQREHAPETETEQESGTEQDTSA
jgi:hypothetical protein